MRARRFLPWKDGRAPARADVIMERRDFLKKSVYAAAGAALAGRGSCGFPAARRRKD